MSTLIELCIAEAFIRPLINQIFLIREKRVIIGNIFLIEFGQSIPLDLYLSLYVLKLAHRFRISKEVLSIYISCDPFFLRKLMNQMRVFRVSQLMGLGLVAMRKRGLDVLGLDVGVLGHLGFFHY